MRSRDAVVKFFLSSLLAIAFCATVRADDESASDPSEDPEKPATPAKVDVDPVADDIAIEERLQRILEATEWFENAWVGVDEGVVFMTGTTDEERYREWAGELAANTQDVVAVVNRIKVTKPAFWDLSPAWKSLEELARKIVQSLPLAAVAFVILLLTVLATGVARKVTRALLKSRVEQSILLSVAVNTVGVIVFLIGVYLVLKVAGLTRLATTVVGGTGLVGLVVGIAFRDIAENFLASILITLQRPFRSGDLVEVDGLLGFVEAVTMRGTLLMDFEGNHIQIPNATIYKNVVKNFTANPNVRLDFVVGIDYADSITRAQESALEVVNQHEAVLAEPAPMILVEELGPSTVNLRIYFWVDGSKHSGLKVRSALVRMVKAHFENEGLTMPDESREVIFPNGVPVRMIEEGRSGGDAAPATAPPRRAPDRDSDQETKAEGGLDAETDTIREQARRARRPEEGADLLEPRNNTTADSPDGRGVR